MFNVGFETCFNINNDLFKYEITLFDFINIFIIEFIITYTYFVSTYFFLKYKCYKDKHEYLKKNKIQKTIYIKSFIILIMLIYFLCTLISVVFLSYHIDSMVQLLSYSCVIMVTILLLGCQICKFIVSIKKQYADINSQEMKTSDNVITTEDISNSESLDSTHELIKNERNLIPHKLALILIFLLLFTLGSFFVLGYCSAQDNKRFRIIDNTQVVLMTTSESYLVADCKIVDKTIFIDTNNQTLIDNINVHTVYRKFDKVKIEK